MKMGDVVKYVGHGCGCGNFRCKSSLGNILAISYKRRGYIFFEKGGLPHNEADWEIAVVPTLEELM
jgi:hypothetical protein